MIVVVVVLVVFNIFVIPVVGFAIDSLDDVVVVSIVAFVVVVEDNTTNGTVIPITTIPTKIPALMIFAGVNLFPVNKAYIIPSGKAVRNEIFNDYIV